MTVNGVLSAILITYLLSRISWLMERKSDVYNRAVLISQKITDFRRILKKLTNNLNVWNNAKQTYFLIDQGKFKHIDFYDYNNKRISDYEPEDSQLIDELYQHNDFSEEQSVLY